MTVCIIGGGASGMAAALASAQTGARTILLERQNRVGRKLLATGNGRCNLTNLSSPMGRYHGNQENFSTYALDRFSPRETLQWFSQMGLLSVAEPSGRVYPYSDQANSVVDVLRFALAQAGVELRCDWEVAKVRKQEGGFGIESTAGEKLSCDRLIVACGGLAGSKLGGSMSGYKLLRGLGHSCTKLRPALVQVETVWKGINALKGVRANCAAKMTHDGFTVAASQGEVQFTDYGLSGPVIFEISRDVCTAPGLWQCQMDFLPHVEEETLLEALTVRCKLDLRAEDLLTGILHNRLGRVLCAQAGISLYTPLRQLERQELLELARQVKSFTLDIARPLGMDSAQVTAGGILTGEFDPETMESRLVPCLFACGEVLDIDGDCGGWNLQWAWSSGRLAGQSAGKE